MNERQPYEKHLADKLQQLPPPADANENWPQMRKLLDEEMPRGGGFGRNRWWLGSILVLLLLTGAWLVGTQFTGNRKQNDATVAATSNTANDSQKPPVNGTVKELAETDQQANEQANTPDKAVASVPSPGKENKPVVIEAPVHSPVDKTGEAGVKSKAPPSVREPSLRNNPYVQKKDKTAGDAGNSLAQGKKTNQINEKDKNIDKNTTLTNRSAKGSSNKPTINTVNEPVLHPSGNYSTIDYTGEMVSPSAAIREKYDPFTENELFPNLVNKRVTAKAKSKSYNAGRTMEAKSFAIGLSLPLGFPLGDQKALGFNSNAGANTVSDYIPAPNFQYHFNSKTYLQTEVQFMTPQFIRPILLYQQVQAVPASNNYIYNSVYAKKLYYFNLPVAIHHSPFKNFYLGTGLQFSTMLSGVAMYEQVKRGPNMQDMLLDEKYTRFGGDSLSSRFNGTEMRVLLDMNYYFNRFTVGLRYNQAVNNYVDFRVNSSLPYTYDKNKQLMFYLRYNLWEDIKRKKPATSFLSLK